MVIRLLLAFFGLVVLFTHCTRQPTSSPRDMSGKPKVGLSPNATLRPTDKQSRRANPRRTEILFLGDNGHHKPLERVPQLMVALGNRGINITYTDQLTDLNASNLAKYDGLLIYANWDSIPKPQERALLDFVASGKGLIPVHCASYCFRNSPEYVDKVVGGQFWRHKMDTIRTRFTDPADAIVVGLEPFSAYDETYLHSHLQADNHVLAVREIKADQAADKPGQAEEPYTWTRNYGKGRVFYTAYGHDERTWSQSGFQQLLERGILWAVGDDIKKLHDDLNPQPFTYGEAKLPNYEKRAGPQLRQEPLSPEESMKHIQVPVDFTLELFAHEPNVMHPIAMAWDERGRLYVLITKDYPNERKPTGGSDSIVICEDTDGDGKADKFTTFADGLSIPTGLVFANGGLVVSQAPDMLFLQDTNGDDRADVRKVLFTGFGTNDTHAGPSNLHYGFDNWIWATVGYSGFKGKVGADSLNFGQAFFRFKADGSQMEMMTRTNNNTWGLGFRETGEVFGSTANNAHGWYMAIPSRYFSEATAHGYNTAMNGSRNTDTHKDMKPITDRVRQVDVFGGFTAAAGQGFYTARNFPKAYWNNVAFVCEPTGHIVHQNVFQKKGTDFQDIEPTNGIGFNLMAGADEWFSPVFAETGPDGAVWVADWYSYIIQHNPTPAGFDNGPGNAYQTNLRDYTHGRIYRVSAKNSGEQPFPKLSKTDPAGLLAALTHSNMFWRMTAQRLLVERGQRDVVPQLVAMVGDTTRDEIGNSPASLHALWTLAGLDVFTDSPSELSGLYPALVHHPASAIRRSMLQLMPKNDGLSQTVMQFQTQNDPESLVRLETLLTLSQAPLSTDASRAMLSQLQNASPTETADRWLADGYAALLTANHNQLLNSYLQTVSMGLDQKLITNEPSSVTENSKSQRGTAKTENPLPGSATENSKSQRGTAKTENRPDLVVTAIRTEPVSPVVREGTRIFVDVKNVGIGALPAGTAVPLALKIEGGTGMTGSPKIEYVSVKYDKGLAPGETVTIQQGNNGPWNADFWVTMEQAGPYTITATLDRQNQIQEAEETNNTATHTFNYRAPARLGTIALERAARSYAAHQPADSVVNLLRQGQRVGSDDFSALIKGASEGWNPKQKAMLSADNQVFLANLSLVLPADAKARLLRLTEAFGLKTDKANDVIEIRLKTVRDIMSYDQKTFTVVAGKPVVLTFENPDEMQHNLVIGQVGSLDIIGAAADKMITAKDGADKNYVPAMPQILAATPLVMPGQTYRLTFTAPTTPGDYPFICTFPGHWRIMNGVMQVK
jgi:uncharacterized protein